jgi:hypothetical protein
LIRNVLLIIVSAFFCACVSCTLVSKGKAKKAGEQLPPAQLPQPGVSAAPAEPEITGLRRQERQAVGERKEYTYRFFRTGEVREKIDSRPEIDRRQYYQCVITFWVEGAKGKGTLKLLCNGKPVANWDELEKLLSEFRLKLIAEKYTRYAEVIIDQVGEVPLKAIDDILAVCFRARIKEIKMSSTEPGKEQ